MIYVSGIGWINKEEYGCIMKKIRASYKDGVVPKKKIFSFPFRNFGRLDNVSRLSCSAVALALRDAKMDYPVKRKSNTGILCAGASGSFQADMRYFRDYLDTGRTLSRGNLFIYTLPSSPAGEAAIHFGLRGPLFHLTAPENPAKAVFATASEMVSSGEASTMLAVVSGEGRSACFVLKKRASARDLLCDSGQAAAILDREPVFDEMIGEFIRLKKGRVTR